jgi:hypothetical protein
VAELDPDAVAAGREREREMWSGHTRWDMVYKAALGLGLLSRREALRVPTRSIEAVPLAATQLWMDRSGREQPTRCAAVGQVTGSTRVGRSARMEVVLTAATAVAMATGNRVLYKLTLVPLREYPFFLVQFTTFGYPSSLLAYQLSPSTIDDRPRCFKSRLLLTATCDQKEELHQLCTGIL